MLDKTGSIIQALVRLVDVYGIGYMREHKKSPYCYSVEDNGKCIVSFLFESSAERPDLIADSLGWAVYATVRVDPKTAETELITAVLPDGKIIK